MKLLRNLHETFAREFSASLSTFLQSEIVATLGEIGFVQAADFRNSLSSPSCLVTLRLHPRQERMILHLDSPTVLGLLERMLGGTGSTAAGHTARADGNRMEPAGGSGSRAGSQSGRSVAAIGRGGV